MSLGVPQRTRSTSPGSGMVVAWLQDMTHPFKLLTATALCATFGISGHSLGGTPAFPADSTSIAGLPLIEVPASRDSGSTMAVILSGDGGWAAGDKQMAAGLTEHGIPVVGLDVPSYLKVSRTPDGAAADLGRLLEHYLSAWHRDSVILIGYSHGAGLAPFMVSRLSEKLRDRIALLAMLGLESRVSFQFHLADIISDIGHEGDLPVLPEVLKLRGTRMLCVSGSDEAHSLCPSLEPSIALVETRPGGHRISGSQGRAMVDVIMQAFTSQPLLGSHH
jgi:type IV secretory pathway VirJ component